MEYWRKAGEGESGLQDLVRNFGLGMGNIQENSWAANRYTNGLHKGNIFPARMSLISDIIPALSRERSFVFYISVNSFS
jgi:hypothetical protein